MQTTIEKTAHTPGPWTVAHYPNSRQTRVTAPGGVEFLETASPGISTDTWNANLRLVAAAPELLVALRGLLAHLESWKTIEVEGEWMAVARDAIAKAEGR